ncbi:MAG: hypothetical protein WCD52_25935 [Xanthobacteraceae bacterium]
MNRRPNNLDARLEKLERSRRPQGIPFFMVWGRSDSELTDAISKAKANGDLQVGDKFNAKIWTDASEPPPPRWVALAEIGYDELKIIAGGRNRTPLNRSEQNVMVNMTNADLSNWYAENLPSLA